MHQVFKLSAGAATPQVRYIFCKLYKKFHWPIKTRHSLGITVFLFPHPDTTLFAAYMQCVLHFPLICSNYSPTSHRTHVSYTYIDIFLHCLCAFVFVSFSTQQASGNFDCLVQRSQEDNFDGCTTRGM